MSTFKVNVTHRRTNTLVQADISEASKEDVTNNQTRSKFNWKDRWNSAAHYCECERLFKLEYQGELQGLMHVTLLPYPPPDGKAEYVEICALESVKDRYRLVNPIGQWLVWYAVNLALEYDCAGDEHGFVLLLESVESAVDYYENKVNMEKVRPISLGEDGDGYVFSFSQRQSFRYLESMAECYGKPIEG